MTVDSSISHIDNEGKSNYISINIVDQDMVLKLGKLQSAYNELHFDIETLLPCTNILFFAY